MSFGRLLALVTIGVLATLASVTAFAQQKDASISDSELESRWADLLGDDPGATRAALVLARHPEETTRFLASRLKPLALSEERLNELLVQLGSDSPDQWQAAFRELEYFDPRLAMGLEEIMDLGLAQTFPTRNRLVAVLSGRNPDPIIEYKHVTLEPVGKDGFNFRGNLEDDPTKSGSWWAEHKIERLNSSWFTPKKPWTRATRALALLESFDTEQSWSVIKTMSTGHPEAKPTKAAMEMIAGKEKR